MQFWRLSSSDFLIPQISEELPEGDLTKIRASLVCEPTLAYCAGDIGLGGLPALGKGRGSHRRTQRAIPWFRDAMEALIGAIYLDGGFANAKEFIHRFILNDIEHKQLFYDSKTISAGDGPEPLQEAHLDYEILREEGPDHNKVFEVQRSIGGEESGTRNGRTKKAAEQVAAYHGILKLKAREKRKAR